ncbi:TM2 domain-containing protein [Nocardioides sp. AE5]|uniref:TM2 domain-containing protein n=1 Tax=Nocardioides sp. AE5 TaxID=2962573 RepID=UPI00288114EB|nr:TM2 domain-containing protein [Nocardioides sp. AE5]MDT0201624.1 TM2 domain-containing protein [Nocardioides sp. AE5]
MSEHDPNDDATRRLPSSGQPGWGEQQPGPPPYGQQAPYGQPAPPPGYGYAPPGFDPAAPFGRHPRSGEPYGEKSKVIAGVLQLLIGTLGIGRFYTGHTGMAIAQLVTCGGCGIWALIDGILILVGDDQRDAEGRLLRS